MDSGRTLPGNRPIRKLDPLVVNKIAAGEIIIQPANALKEMLENSIDAHATNIEVVVKDGGLKLLKITDNGLGINRADMPLLCERFATLKLQSFNDLSNISTYGFRGEALASISHISRVSVITKTADSPLAYQGFYTNGKLCTPNYKSGELDLTDPKPIAGRDGTQITVEDLFYNVPTRLRGMKSKSDELSRVLDIVGRYAVHSANVSLSCKKLGDAHQIVSTRAGIPLKERIRSVFSSNIANELVTIQANGDEVDDLETALPLSEFGIIKILASFTGPNFVNKKHVAPVFFINNRLVACEPLRRGLNLVFQLFLPRGDHPFIYLSLDIVPQNVDVNVHPTKREVRFLFEDEVIQFITGKVHDALSSVDDSRAYKMQSFIPGTKIEKRVGEFPSTINSLGKKPRHENKLVRVDSQQSKIAAFLSLQPEVQYKAQSSRALAATQEINNPTSEELFVEEETLFDANPGRDPGVDASIHLSLNHVAKERVRVNLESIITLRQEVTDSVHRNLTNIFSQAVFVGIVLEEKRLCCFQYDTGLFMCDYAYLCQEFYYQVALAEFSNFGTIELSSPIALEDLLAPIYDVHGSETLRPASEIIESICAMENMFKEYFQVLIDTTNPDRPTLTQLPMLVKDIMPDLSKLPYFIYRLGAHVDYSNERECLREIAKQVAMLYIPDSIPRGTTEEELEDAETRRLTLHHQFENILFPQMNKRLLAPLELEKNMVQVTDLPTLYRVFERC